MGVVLRLLHLSDIHFYETETANKALNLDEAVRARLLIDVGEMVARLGPCDAVLVVGDIGARGDPSDYATATQFLVGVTELVGCDDNRVICVPGNHDVNRSAHTATHDALRGQLRRVPANTISDTLQRLLADPPAAETLLRPFEAYNEFALAFGCDISASAPTWVPKKLPLGSRDLVIHGITSSWIADSSDDDTEDSRKLVTGVFQYAPVGADPSDISMTLCHHPVSWLRDVADVRQWDTAAHVILTGHEHSFGIEVDSGLRWVRIASGAVNPARAEDGWVPAYNIIELDDVESTDEQLRLRVYVRSWQDAQFGPDARFDDPEVITLELDRGGRRESKHVDVHPRALNDIEQAHGHRVMTAPPDRRRTLARELGFPGEPEIGLDGDRSILRWAAESGKLAEFAARLVEESLDG